MSYQHKDLKNGRWQKMSLMEQMSNIGSEIQRAINWNKKNNPQYSKKSLERALELIDLTLDSNKPFSQLREIARVRELLIDYFYGENEYSSSNELWEKYFLQFNLAVRKKY